MGGAIMINHQRSGHVAGECQVLPPLSLDGPCRSTICLLDSRGLTVWRAQYDETLRQSQRHVQLGSGKLL